MAIGGGDARQSEGANMYLGSYPCVFSACLEFHWSRASLDRGGMVGKNKKGKQNPLGLYADTVGHHEDFKFKG